MAVSTGNSTAAIFDGVSRQIGAVLVIWSATAMAGPSGRVVRVERTVGGTNVAPRLCDVRGDSGTCIGEEPRAGQTVIVLDERHVVTEVQIVETARAVASCDHLWTVKTRVIRGVAADGDGIGLIAPGIHPSRARVLDKRNLPVSPSGLSGEEVWRAIDRDGDGTADILVTHHNCDATAAVTGRTAGCIEIWARIGARLTRTTQINLAQCNP